MLQRDDIEPKCRNTLGDALGIVAFAFHCARCKLGNTVAQDLVERRRLIEFENRKRALDLRKKRQQRSKFAGFQRVAEVIVQRAFDGSEIDLDFLTHLKNQQALLGAFADVIHQGIGFGRNVRQHSAHHRPLHARDHTGYLYREIAGKTEEIFKRSLGEQQCSGDFQPLRL